MNSFLVMEDYEIDYVWHGIQSRQLVFHPTISPDGMFDIHKFNKIKRSKEIMLFLDRNILSSLLKFCEKGSLLNEDERIAIALIMTWAEMNQIPISAGLAIQEYATQIGNQDLGLTELQKFLEIFDAYPGQIWLRVAEGLIDEINPIKFSGEKAKNITASYSTGNDHYYMTVASMLHLVRLYRDEELAPVDKMLSFLKWTYDNILLSQYVLTYAAMLFTGQENIKAPKHSKSNDIDKVIYGCENQAWDLSYLSTWSTLYWDEDKSNKIFLFASNDILLKRIFINTHSDNGILHVVFSQKDYDKILDYIEERSKNRVKPDFGKEPLVYFENLIQSEKDELCKSM